MIFIFYFFFDIFWGVRLLGGWPLWFLRGKGGCVICICILCSLNDLSNQNKSIIGILLATRASINSSFVKLRKNYDLETIMIFWNVVDNRNVITRSVLLIKNPLIGSIWIIHTILLHSCIISYYIVCYQHDSISSGQSKLSTTNRQLFR